MSVEASFKQGDEDGTGNQSDDDDDFLSLYADHETEDEIIVGPVEIRRPMLTFRFQAAKKDPEPPTNSHPCKICQSKNTKHYTCSECDLCVFSKIAMVGHLRKHRRPPSICNICKKSYQYEHVLRKHMIKHSNKRSFKCKVCLKAYKHEFSLSVHKCTKPKKKPFSCEHCPKSFSLKGQLQVHTRLHTGEKPYRCHICSQEFTQQTSLNNHVLKHKGIKPHRCKFCKERFRQLSNLKNHVERNHSQECRQKKSSSIALVWYTCKNCQVVLTGTESFNKHMAACN